MTFHQINKTGTILQDIKKEIIRLGLFGLPVFTGKSTFSINGP